MNANIPGLEGFLGFDIGPSPAAQLGQTLGAGFQTGTQTAVKQLMEGLRRQPQMTPFQKIMEERQAGRIADYIEEVPKAFQTQKNIGRLRELSEDIGAGGPLALIPTEARSEFNALGLMAIESPLKVLNPRGVIPQRKIEMLKDLYAPKATDFKAKREGKLRAIEQLNQKSLSFANRYMELMERYDGNPPFNELVKLERNVESEIDDLIKAGRTTRTTPAGRRTPGDRDDRVLMIDPAGQRRRVPRDQVKAAQQANYRLDR